MRNLNAVLLLAAAGLAVGLWPLLGAQGQAENQRQAPIQFGDILLSNFRTAQVRLGTQAVVRGPDTQVDATDPKSGGKGRLLASQISAFMVPKSNLVERRVPPPTARALSHCAGAARRRSSMCRSASWCSVVR